ncbi:hypothetical protein L208DRAFT_1381398 [Tricholoma matsutake]|nr:hypothetical protein L208DRAFT_1381398 [Tricholoma matsutake 945]
MAAHNTSQDILTLLKDYQITDIDIEFHESFYTHEVSPQLLGPIDELDPLIDIVSPLTPALGLHISTKARPNSQGMMMALYLTKGGSSDRLLGLSCCHILIGSNEAANVNYVHHPSGPSKDVLLLSKRAFSNLINSIKLRIRQHAITVEHWREQIEGFEQRERGTNTVDIEKAMAARIETQGMLDKAERAIEALRVLLHWVNKDWKKLNNRILGHILYSPAITLGIGEHSFAEDWGMFEVDSAKLSDSFQGNKMDLETKLMSNEFTVKCFPHRDANWKFKYPKDRLLPLRGTITNALMCNPDMWDLNGKLCLLVIKSGNATGTTIGHVNGIFSIIHHHFNDMSINQTSMEWGILNYDSKSEVFSEPGDSSSAITDIHGRIGGMLTSSSGKLKSSDMTYATLFWWLLKHIRANGFPNAHLNNILLPHI